MFYYAFCREYKDTIDETKIDPFMRMELYYLYDKLKVINKDISNHIGLCIFTFIIIGTFFVIGLGIIGG
jgi:hypothetical protein